MVTAPKFEVDPHWPKPLPNHWILGEAIGLGVDAQDHLLIVHRQGTLAAEKRGWIRSRPPRAAARRRRRCSSSIRRAICVRRWGGPGEGYDWPQSNHGLTIDHKNNVWIGGNVGTDSHILKFTQDGKFIAQYGKPQPKPTGSNDTENFGRVAKIFVDPRRERGVHRRRLRQQARRGARRRYRQVQAILGRLRQQAGRREPRRVRSGCTAGAAVPHACSLRRSVERRPGLRLRPAEQPAPGLHQGREVRQGSVLLQEDAGRRRRLGRRVLEGS